MKSTAELRYNKNMSILCIDFMNQAHRARSGFLSGDYPVVYNFFRAFKSLVDQFKPTRVYIVLEGRPVKRYDLLPEYKATRKVEEPDPKYADLQKFFKQKDEIVRMLTDYFPVSVVRHHTSECDDTIYNLINRSSTAVPWTVVSNDTDFIQLLQKFNHVKIWNPIKKEYAEAPAEYDYVTWKSIRGDGSDNIPGIPGVGDKTAANLSSDPEKLAKFLSDPERATTFQRNYDLISFKEWSDEERVEMTCSSPSKNWDSVKSSFSNFGFNSITKEGSWEKFVASFDYLFGGNNT
jgi:5'-3' exonuclease